MKQVPKASAGVYLSIPFCRQKCTYCNFASDAFASSLLSPYLRHLESEIRYRAELWQKAGIVVAENQTVDTIYLGGGTPGLLDGPQLERLFDAVRASFRVEKEPEVTLEASPENVTPASAEAWARCGVNRVSMGVQSMVRQELRAVGRLHDADTVRLAVSILRAVGIENLSADLIAGLPHQTDHSWAASLDALLDLGLPHLSVYMLEVDEDSRLGKELLEGGSRYRAGAVPADEEVVEFYRAAVERLRAASLLQYEISNFARPGCESRHNLKYWTNRPYFGFGVEAHSYDGERRWANTDSLEKYLDRMQRNQSPIAEQKTLAPREKLEERFFLGLRRRQGVSLRDVSLEFGADSLQPYVRSIQEFRQAGWLQSDGDSLWLTDQGVVFSNEVFAGFL